MEDIKAGPWVAITNEIHYLNWAQFMEYSIFTMFEYKGMSLCQYAIDSVGHRIQFIWKEGTNFTACTVNAWHGSPEEMKILRTFLLSQFGIADTLRAFTELKSVAGAPPSV